MTKELRKATEFTVVRKRWRRGSFGSALLRGGDGEMCCMGFYALACGYSENDIRNKITLSALYGIGAELQTSVVRGVASPREENMVDATECVYAQNDSRDISDAERERRITELLARRGVTVHFVDDDGEATP